MTKKRYQSHLSKHGEKTVGVRRINKLLQKPETFQSDALTIQNSIRAMFLFGVSEFLHSNSLRLHTIEELLPQDTIRKKKPTKPKTKA